MSPARVLCLDGGRSGCRARLRLRSGEAVESTGPPLPYFDGPGAVEGFLEALTEALAGLPEARAEVVVAGLAGVFEHFGHAPALAGRLATRTGARRVVVTGDLVTSYAGALGLEAGAVVAAGTGAVAFAVGPDGRSARSDGWGYLLGDEGSGFWIGRAGLAAALAHQDGRGGSAALRDRAAAAFGPLERLAEVVYGDAAPVETVAGFAPEVAAAALAGDRAAAALWAGAGRRLAASMAAAAGRVLPRLAAPASWTGGLFATGELLLAPFREELARLCPYLELRPPAGTALDGAERLAAVEPLPPQLGHAHVAP